MGNFGVEVKFTDSYFKKLGLKNNKGVEEAIDRAIEHTIHDAENIARREAPIDTGNLRRSIHKRKPRKCVGELRSRAHYWVYLQYGTSKMDANPFVTRTARRVGPKMKEYTLQELKNAGVLD